jgi:hypothetical protein
MKPVRKAIEEPEYQIGHETLTGSLMLRVRREAASFEEDDPGDFVNAELLALCGR